MGGNKMRMKPQLLFLSILTILFCVTSNVCFADQGMIPAAPITPAPALDNPVKRELMLFEDIPIVTSVSKRAESLRDAPAAISVITREDIESMDYVNLWDYFRRVPGVDVETLDGRTGSVAPRGFIERFTRRNQLLIDGRSAYTPLYGGTEWDFIPLLPEDIERIEVIRGPNATLYGSNAVNGVINIITRDPKDVKGVFEKVGLGSHGYERELIRYGGNVKKLDYRLSYAWHRDDGYGSRSGKDVNDWEKDHTFVWQSTYTINDKSNWELSLGDKEDRGRPGSVSSASSQTGAHVRSQYQMVKYNTKVFDDQDLHFQFSRSEVMENKHGNRQLYRDKNDVQVDQYDFEMEHVFKWLKDKMNTVWGTGFRYNKGESYIFDAGTNLKTYGGDGRVDRIYRLFFNNDYKINDLFTFVFGDMFENNGFTGASNSPRSSLMFFPKENHKFRLTYARAYRTPTFIEDKQNLSFGPGSVIGNTSLKKEVVDAYELGYTYWGFSRKLKLGAEGYINSYKDIIRTVPSGANFTYDNNNSAWSKGLEFEAEVNPVDWVKFYTNFTFENIEDKNMDFVNTHPKYKQNFGSRLNLDKIGVTVNFDGYFVGTYQSYDVEDTTKTAVKIRPYLRFDFRIAKTFLKGNLEWAIKGENMFDQSHLETRAVTAGVPVDIDIERAVYTTLTAKF